MIHYSAVLSDREIRDLCNSSPPLIEDFIDFEHQLQPTGFDVTVKKIVRLSGEAQIGNPYHNKVASESDVKITDGWYVLKSGFYVIYINEFTNIPNNLMGLAFPRSTLFRCGGTLQSGVWDGGFKGRGRLGLCVSGVTHLRIEENCPIAQLVFFPAFGVEKGFQFNEFYRE
ncbi:MAG: Deoxyuridine 5'-triphosphate nucleotidohydrolase [candidate division CPR2 bacterium GW2011_GWC1_39_9]|uniref:Deoxyuridine 5'-triphosphate nucleotidohydrolase n=1 Tax=candidate division CPR2 bacterium GW2011_GWC2_39_10 TaxID=1618345 RepID=A0A0G0PWK4_UNCC2|nr:MAG: Deoxyuridine 5'-triphosphate nucleotidohydrolase [candidate division CPR2 bacterium GW2011_GWC2_39_10]KKR33681.1 MAG: Deoxyuridine 5'-triphosphate nucleotidohydrolase [candidate division CPR2 bacterium GW2011_GWC1_39_9]